MVAGGKAGPTTLRASAAVCWLMALVPSGLEFDKIQDDDDQYTYDWATWRYNPVVPTLALAAVGLYIGLCWAFRVFGGAAASKEADGYPMWTYFTSSIHCFVFLPLAMLKIWMDQPQGRGFYEFGTAEEAKSPGDYAVFICILGYLLRDFHVYDFGLDLVYVIHHVLSIAGCILCLQFPIASAMTGFFAVQAEVASGTFNIVTMWPENLLAKLIYASIMGYSQYISAVIVYTYWIGPYALSFRLWFLCLSIVVQFIRTIGYVLFLMSLFSSSKSEEKKE